MATKTIATEIEIDADPDRVWEVFSDFDAYPTWNPVIKSVKGDTAVGSKLEVRIEPPEGRGMTFKPTVRASEPGREFRWLGKLLLGRLRS